MVARGGSVGKDDRLPGAIIFDGIMQKEGLQDAGTGECNGVLNAQMTVQAGS